MEDSVLNKKSIADEKFFNKMLNKKLASYITPDLAIATMANYYAKDDMVKSLAMAKGIDEDFFRYNEMSQVNVLFVIASIFVNEKQRNEGISENDLFLMINDGVLSIDLESFDNTVFKSNPIISNISNVISIIKTKLSDDTSFYNIMLNNILDSLKAVYDLYNTKCFTQAMSVFRQALEHFITLKALDMNPNALESYFIHQRVTAADVLGEMSPEDLDKYIKDNNLTYNTYKSYMNYGWLDEVEAYRKLKEEKPKTKYGIKVITEVTGQQEFYEAMDFASNYVHPNFIFVNVDWDMVIKEVIDGTYQMLDWTISYMEKNDMNLVSNDYDFRLVYERIKSYAKSVISIDGYSFNIK